MRGGREGGRERGRGTREGGEGEREGTREGGNEGGREEEGIGAEGKWRKGGGGRLSHIHMFMYVQSM